MALKRKKPNQPVLTLFPSFNLRQAAIVVALIEVCMREGLEVDGEQVTADEWLGILRQMLRH